MAVIAQFPGLLGGPEILIILLVWIVIAVFIGRWIYRDARSRGSDWAWQWGVGIGVLFIGVGPGFLALIIYFLVRGEKRQNDSQQKF